MQGRRGDERFLPQTVDQHYKWRDQYRRIVMAYAPDGAIRTRILTPESPGKRKKVPAAMQRGTVDPVTALMNATHAPLGEGRCGGTFRTFEGRRRADARIEHVGRDRLPATPISGLPKDAVKCQFFIDRLAGFRPRHMRNFPDPLPPAEMWAVPFPKHGFWLPVVIRVSTKWGPLYATLTRLEIRPADRANAE